MKTPSKGDRIAWNTILLYLRMVVVLLINLYSVRILFNALGIVDYGIYNVVAGVITLMYSISGVLSSSTQRFYSYAIGEGDYQKLGNIFSVSLTIHVALAILIIILGETIGLWFVNNELIIPRERMLAVNWIYQFSIISFVSLVLQVPFSAAVIANEDMGLFSIISIIESCIKLLAAIALISTEYDRLILYGAITMLASVFVLVLYIFIVRIKYDQCRYERPRERELFNELLSYSGWTLMGSVSNVGMFQVNTIITNVFFGPTVNAARAISIQFMQAINSFTGSILLAVRSQMIKSFAEGDYQYLDMIFYLSNKIIYFGLLMICLPLIFEIEVFLNLWIGYTDENTQLFSSLILVYAIIMALNNPISIVIQATGNVREYHLLVESFTLLIVPITYIMYHFGYNAHWAYIIMIVAAVMAHVVRLILLKKYYDHFIIGDYYKLFVIPAIVITIVIISSIVFTRHYIQSETIRVLMVICQSSVTIPLLAYVFGLTAVEKNYLNEIFAKIKGRIVGERK